MRSIVVGTAGHIDHGKSALVRALTGTDPDRLKEEQARGITIDLGFAHLVHGGVNFAFVDVPGHERFVKNMLAGAGGIDLVLLVVAADESVMPQTREHFDICRLLGIRAGLIALTKSDLVDADTLELTRLEVADLVAGSFLEGAPVVPVSSKSGAGLAEVRQALLDTAAHSDTRDSGGAARVPIDRVFSMRGFGTVVTGTIASGSIGEGDALEIAPGGLRVTVRGVQVHGEKRDRASAGQRAAVNLAGVDVQDVARGQSLVDPRAFAATRILDAAVDMLPSAPPLKHGTRVRFHQGTAELLGRVAVIGEAGPDGRAPALAGGASGLVRVRLEGRAVVTRGDRFILRAYSPAVTIGGGWVLDPNPPRGGVRSAAVAARCAALASSSASGSGDSLIAARVMIEGAGRAGLPRAALVWRAGLPPNAVDPLVATLIDSGAAVAAGEVLVWSEVVATLSRGIPELLAEHHRREPLSEGAPREEVRQRLFRRGTPAVFEHVVASLAARGVIAGSDRLRLAAHRPVLSDEEGRTRAVIEDALRAGALTPPDVAAVAAAAGLSRAVVDRVLQLLQRERRLVKIDQLWFHADALQALKERVSGLKRREEAAAIDVAAFKEQFGVTRKFAIPLLEYLDRERVTRRVGDRRLIL